MNTKTMEGLIGARTNMELVNTPMRVYKEARLKGDTATMERAMGYVNEFEEDAFEYKDTADEGMREDAKEAREKAKAELEKVIEKCRKEREKLEERIEESREEREDQVEISDEGKALLEENTESDNADLGNTVSAETKIDTNNIDTDSIVNKPVTYTKTGEVSRTGQNASISISV